MNRHKKRWIRPLALILGALLLTLAVELVVFNRKALFTGSQAWVPLPEPEITGDLAEDGKVTLSYQRLDREIRHCHFDIEVLDEDGAAVVTTFTVMITDEGNKNSYPAGTIAYLPGCDKAAWFSLNSYGKVDRLILVLTSGKGRTYTVRAAEINGGVPFRISVPRMLAILGLLAVLWLLRPGSFLYDNRLWNRQRWYKPVCILLVLLLNAAALWRLGLSNEAMVRIPDEEHWDHHYQYALLARALAEGRTNIETPEQREMLDLLGEMENPYNHSARKALLVENGMDRPWDEAYYNGHLYVYFGVVPVLLTYLPYYLITGRDLPTVWAVILAGALAVTAAFALLRALIRRYYPETPFPVYVLLSLLLGNCSGVLCHALDPTFYVVPIHFAQAFIFLALALWLSAADRWKPAEAVPAPERCCFAPIRGGGGAAAVVLRIAGGSLLAALVAGCRPQFLVYSALALPIFLPLIRQEKGRGVILRRAAAFCLPYLAVAIPLMYYNAIRFGSPLDFGANYNLTTNDMTHRGFRLERLPDGLFAYLFRLPNVELSFPYVKEAATTPIYMGKTIQEPMFGGVLLVFPFLWSLLGTRRVSPLLREKKLRLLTLLPLVLVLIVAAADTEMAGILWRYTGDFLPLLFLSAGIVFLALLQTAGPRLRRVLQGFLTLTALLALLTCLLISVTNGKLLERSPESYFQLKDFLSWT